MAMKKIVIEQDVLEVTLDGNSIDVEKDGFAVTLNKEEAFKVANALLTVLNKTRRDEDE